ncbi:uncharacterized protein [Dysidea avara]|uniref:uncharacterized protein isoform X2 n=1 Tax=Dysidea avara TaxID=196820 RepID=UPI0033281197
MILKDTGAKMENMIAEVFVGNSKESLSLKPNPDLAVNSVAKEFGKFIKFFVDTSEDVCVVEVQRPSLHVKTPKKTLPFSASVQHVKNVDMMMLCEECDMWRLLYCKTKLKKTQRTSLESLLDNYSYTCGSSLQDMELPEPFSEVYVRNINCYDPIEKLYYSAGYTPICIYCAEEVEVDVDSAFYPQCAHCQKPKIKK